MIVPFSCPIYSPKAVTTLHEVFDFTIENYVGEGYLLSIGYSGDGDHNITGAGEAPARSGRNLRVQVKPKGHRCMQL